MRRIAVLAVLGAILGVAAPAYAVSVSNSSGSQQEVVANWYFEDGNGGFGYGYAVGVKVKGGGSYIELFEETITPITCDNGTGDGYHVEFVSGWGEASVVVDKRYRSGSATAVLDLYTESFDDCFVFAAHSNNGGGGTVIEDVPVAIDVTATGPLTMSRSSSGFHIPSEVNENSRFDASWRTGTGTVTWGDVERSADNAYFDAYVGKISWRFHSNS